VTPPYDGHTYLFDTSVWIRTKHPLIAPDWQPAMRKNQLAVSPIVAFEILYSARNQTDFEALERQLDALRQAPFSGAGCARGSRCCIRQQQGHPHPQAAAVSR
jgi:predicted nucleic acid-binding protein